MAQVTYEIDILGERRVIEKLGDIDKAITDINAKIKTLNIGDTVNIDALNKTKQGLLEMRGRLTDYNQALGQTSRVGSQAGIALQNLNFVVRDSPYFFKDMQLGMLAVGNNLNPLIDSFIKLRLEAQRTSAETGKVVTTFGLLRNAMVGGIGLSVAFSLLVTAIQAFVFAQQDSKKATDEGTEAIEKQRIALEKLTREQIDYQLQNIKLRRIDILGTPQQIGQNPILRTLDLLRGVSDEDKEILATDEERQRVLENTLFWLGDIENIENRLVINRQKQKDLNENTWKLLVHNAKSLEDAKDIVAQWIKSDELLLKSEQRITKEVKDRKKHIYDVKNLLEEMLDVLTLSEEERKKRWIDAAKDTRAFWERDGVFGAKNIKNPMDEMQRQIEDELKPIFQSITEVANVAGNAISNAFLSGKNAIDAATQALMQFIVQLLVVQSLKGLLGMAFGLPFGAGFLSGIVPSAGGAGGALPKLPMPNGGLNKSVVRVEGKITADKNNFIANIRNADNYYSRNEEFVLVGR